MAREQSGTAGGDGAVGCFSTVAAFAAAAAGRALISLPLHCLPESYPSQPIRVTSVSCKLAPEQRVISAPVTQSQAALFLPRRHGGKKHIRTHTRAHTRPPPPPNSLTHTHTGAAPSPTPTRRWACRGAPPPATCVAAPSESYPSRPIRVVSESHKLASGPCSSPIRVACPSRLSESLVRVACPSHLSESLIRVTYPSRSAGEGGAPQAHHGAPPRRPRRQAGGGARRRRAALPPSPAGLRGAHSCIYDT